MWYFNLQNFIDEDIVHLKEVELQYILDNSDEYQVMYPKGDYEEKSSLFNGYKILIDGDTKLVREDNFETGSWQIYRGKFNYKNKIELKNFLRYEDVFDIKFLKKDKIIFEISDFGDFLVHDEGLYERLFRYGLF